MKISICFLSTIKNHFNLQELINQSNNSKNHQIDIYEYINDENNIDDYKIDNNTIYFKFNYLRNKFNYHHIYYNEAAEYSAGMQFLTLLDMYINHKNEYDIYMFYEDDLSYFGKDNLFDKIDFNCDVIFQSPRLTIEDDKWWWWYNNNDHFINENLIIYHGLLNIYALKNYVCDNLLKFIQNNYLHHEGLISTYVLNNYNNIHYINNYINSYLDFNDSYWDNPTKYDLIHPIKLYERYKCIKEIYENK